MVDDRDLAGLADWLRGRLPILADEAFRAVRARIPLYDEDDLVSHEELRRSVEENLSFVVAAIRNDVAAPVDLGAPEETGRRRARMSVPLPEVLRSYRITFATLWQALVEHARDVSTTVDTEALLGLASRLWQLTDEHAVALTEAYRATTAELLLAQQRRRSAIVEALFTGQSGPESSLAEAAALLGLPPRSLLAVVAAETRGLAEESLPRVEQTLAARGIVSAWRLTPALQLGIVALGGTDTEVLVETLSRIATAPVGVSPPYRSLAQTQRALQLARAALAAPRGEGGLVRPFSRSPLAALVASAPEEAARLAHDVLGSVLALPPEDRDVLLDTLAVYVEAGASAERAGVLLHCHPNTVRYRLRRLHELTGHAPSEPGGLAELAAASYAVRTGVAPGRTRPPAKG